jgi:hypothetical protein
VRVYERTFVLGSVEMKVVRAPPILRFVIPVAHRCALECVCGRLADSAVQWAVTGSVALALPGVRVACRDLEIVASEAGVHEIEQLFAGHVVEPVGFGTRGRLRGHLGRLRLENVEVDVLGDVQNLLPNGAWTVPPRLDALVVWVRVGEHRCPVVRLAHLHDAYEATGCSEKVALVASALRSHASSE